MASFTSKFQSFSTPNTLRRLQISRRHVIYGVVSFAFVLALYNFLPAFSHAYHNEPFTGKVPLRPGKSQPPPTVPEDMIDWSGRANEVKKAFRHAYYGYEVYAAPMDNLRPVSNDGIQEIDGWGVTLYDSLSTMLLMELHDEFARALPVIEQQDFSKTLIFPPKTQEPGDHIAFDAHKAQFIPFFETVIRYLGGLLSAYALSHEFILLKRADDLATKLSGVFDTPHGMPAYSVNPLTGQPSNRTHTILAEMATFQLEYLYLARMTGKKEHHDRVTKVMDIIKHKTLVDTYGMLPTEWNVTTGQPEITGHLSVGANADSGHEYLLKSYLLSGKVDKINLELYVQTVNTVLSSLLYVSPRRGLLYVTDAAPINNATHQFEHLSCFFPGLLALGVHTLPDAAFDNESSPKAVSGNDADELKYYDWKELHLLAAQGLAESCYQMYEDEPTGLGPDVVLFDGGELWIRELKKWRQGGMEGTPPGIHAKKMTEVRHGVDDYGLLSQRYLLRPETVESMFLMWKVTGDVVWRERGWRIFQALEKEAKTSTGYSSLYDVTNPGYPLMNDMPSYFLAETLKYLYLLFNDKDLVPLDRWVFNTEAHPLPIFNWSSWEHKKFGIA
ncbi:mannosidase [Irpex rosettiformis]|uniref:Mannosidase n=1 Tax=Irpex rosettiformis TaxID=378272 RepID=A0ACB8TP04_9APHY|nr:mannosidase [Irpex rosettiformis]